MRRFLLLSLLLASFTLRMEDFKILFLNTENIKIGNTIRKVGDTFSDGDKIVWKDGKQAMKVVSLETKKQYVLVSEDFKQRKIKSAKDFIIKSNRMSSRGIGNLSSVANQVGKKIYWIDPIVINVSFEPEDEEYYYFESESQKCILEYRAGQLIIDSSIWGDNSPHQTTVDLYFHFADGKNELIQSEIEIVPLPNEVLLKGRRR